LKINKNNNKWEECKIDKESNYKFEGKKIQMDEKFSGFLGLIEIDKYQALLLINQVEMICKFKDHIIYEIKEVVFKPTMKVKKKKIKK
jgi:hypothetical protein